jgi:dipeptidyl aminopeptidase/acylaminoacyl peptidase
LEWEEPLKHGDIVRSAAFSPDGRSVAVSTKNGMVRVWDVATGLPLTEGLRHRASVQKVEFSPDSRRLATTSVDQGAWLWELPIPDAPAPPWLPDLAEFVAVGIRDETGQDAAGHWRTYTRIKAEVMKSTATDFYTRWAKWFFGDPIARSISPWSDLPTAEYIKRLIEKGTLASLRESIHLDPTNGLALARLAVRISRQSVEENPRKAGEADFLIRRALQFSPNDPEVGRIRAAIPQPVAQHP